MSNQENSKVTATYQATSGVIASTNTVTITIANVVGAGASSSFLLGTSRILGLRYSSDAAGLVPVNVGSTLVPAYFYVKSITQSAAAGSVSSVAIIIQSASSTVGNAYATLVWANETAPSQLNVYPC
jgi:hypothetical protein